MYVIITLYVRVTVITVTYGKWMTIYIMEPLKDNVYLDTMLKQSTCTYHEDAHNTSLPRKPDWPCTHLTRHEVAHP